MLILTHFVHTRSSKICQTSDWEQLEQVWDATLRWRGNSFSFLSHFRESPLGNVNLFELSSVWSSISLRRRWPGAAWPAQTSTMCLDQLRGQNLTSGGLKYHHHILSLTPLPPFLVLAFWNLIILASLSEGSSPSFCRLKAEKEWEKAAESLGELSQVL